MNGPGQVWFVCGFGDPAAGLGGLAWDLGEPAALLLKEGEVRLATFALEEGGDAATLEIAAGEATVEATLSPRTAEIPLGDGTVTGPTVVDCAAEVVSKDGSRTVQCVGQISRWTGDPLASAGTFRHLAIDAGEEALLFVQARGEPGAEGHGAERTGGWLLRGEDVTRFEDVFISTQYDAADDPTRFGLELWPEAVERASRAAATRVAASAVGGVREGATWAGLFRCHTDGNDGLGSYLLWRG
jgi:hypothetical protein